MEESYFLALCISDEEPIIPDFVNGFIAYNEDFKKWKSFPNDIKS